MKGLFEQLWAMLMPILLAFLTALLGGCGTLRLAESGEVGIRYGTSITFFSQATETKATSAVEWKMPSVEEWIKAKVETVEP